MTTYEQTIWQDEEWYLEEELYWEAETAETLPRRWPPELYLFAAVGLLMAIGIILSLNRPSPPTTPFIPANSQPQAASESISAEIMPAIDASFTPIYDEYIITQGQHGNSYGHNAIDIAAGAGEPILSPVSGSVSAVYTDEWGNPTLIIENDAYIITFLHGSYSVSLGQKIAPGDTLGAEGNQGNTYDMAGNSCRGRSCGYHTHLNVFSKQLNSNINPLDLIE